jgi:hypothetical protein
MKFLRQILQYRKQRRYLCIYKIKIPRHLKILGSGKFYLDILAKQSAAVTPMKPKNGADVGQTSNDTVILNQLFWFVKYFLEVLVSTELKFSVRPSVRPSQFLTEKNKNGMDEKIRKN